MRKSLIQHLEQRGVQVSLDRHPLSKWVVHSVGLAKHPRHSSATHQPDHLAGHLWSLSLLICKVGAMVYSPGTS